MHVHQQSYFPSHAPATASCRAGPVTYSTRQASCDAGVATSLILHTPKPQQPNFLSKRKIKASVWQKIHSVSPTWNLPQLFSPLRSKARLTPVRGSHFPSTYWHFTTSLSKITCPAQFSSFYKHFISLQLLSWSWDSQAELFSGLPHTNSIVRVRNRASNSTCFPGKKKSVKITSLNKLNHLTLKSSSHSSSMRTPIKKKETRTT